MTIFFGLSTTGLSKTVGFATAGFATAGFATAGLMVAAPVALAQTTLDQPSVTQFLSDSAPAECTIQVTSVDPVDAERDAADILSDIPTTPCEAVHGTDDSNSKNFNFLNLTDSNFYKVITTSAPVDERRSEKFQFLVEGVKVVPLDEEGNAVALSEVEYLYPNDEQVCTTDAIEQPRSVVCTFEVKEAGNILVGQLSYAW